MLALEWRNKMSVAPKLGHSDGMVVMYLGERAVVFPSEADARFFYESYSAVPKLAGEAATLRQQIDEGALHLARARVLEVESQNRDLNDEIAHLKALLSTEVARRTAAVRRATLLAKAIRRIRDAL